MRLQHVSIPIPAGGEAEARAFYAGLLGLEERDVPPSLDPNAFIWFRLGLPELELHLMIVTAEPPGNHHFCVEVSALEDLRARLDAAGRPTSDGTPIIGRERFFCRDPFGNLIEFARLERPHT
jgi:catechol 2,3-dioxygenase-like lactoylglutathione lyase family enzyme